jgi:hypothetical protein
MTTIRKKTIKKIAATKPASDPIDMLIYEHHLKIKGIVVSKKYDRIYVVLNTGTTIPVIISDFPRLKGAKEEKLNKWRLIGNGAGIHWQDIDEDLSLKGFLRMINIPERKAVINKVKKHQELVVA